jgi:mRNA-degrading endonuclease RelE of RelBE toxin-antitoxin system
MVIIETSVFTRQVQKLLSEDEYHRLQLAIINRPDSGAIVQGSGGLRKLRWSAGGRGKRGGSRVIYYWAVNEEQILMLLIYPKNVRDNLTRDQLSALRKIVEAEFHGR